MLINVVNLTKSFSDHKLFEDISFIINKGDKIALIGPNGCGKTTIFDIVFGKIEPDSGQVVKNKELKIAYMPQKIDGQYAERCLEFLRGVLLGDKTADKAVLNEVVLGLDLWDIIENKAEGLSGGQKVKIALAYSLILPCDLLLLDEPTNYLDIKSASWLEGFLKDRGVTFIVISHDQYFIGRVTNKVFYLGREGLEIYDGSYDDYLKKKEKEISRQVVTYKNQMDYKKRIEKNIAKKSDYANAIEKGTKDFLIRVKAKTLAKSAKSYQKRLRRMMGSAEWVDKPYEGATAYVKLDKEAEQGKTLVRAKDVSFSYDGSHAIVIGASFVVGAGEKIAIMGENGSGKTTFLELIAGRLKPNKGEVWRNPDASIAYFSQEEGDIDESLTAVEAVRKGLKVTEEEACSVLGGLLVSEKLWRQKVSQLSEGERTKVGFARKVLENPDLLILDEFFAHLDIDAITGVRKAIDKYRGAVILVTHDRKLLQELKIDKFYEMKYGEIRELLGGLA